MKRHVSQLLLAALTAAQAVLIGATAGWAQRTPRGSTTEEAPLTVHVTGAATVDLTALYGDSTTYLPLVALFRHLEIEVALDSAGERASGHYVRPDRPYALELGKRLARIGGRTVPLDSTEFILWQNELYVTPALMTRVFGIQASVDIPSLSVVVTSQDTFPVAFAGARQQEREQRLALRPKLAPAPLEYARAPKLLNGLMLDYEVTGQAAAGNSYALSDVHSGGELLGGDFQAALHAGNGRGVSTGAALWHRVVDAPHRLLTQVNVGSLSSIGLQGQPMHGIQLTNEPVERRTVLAEQVFTGMTHPEWEVELYMGDQIIAYTRADLSGHYSFNLPLPYGSSLLSVRAYGPTGGQEEEQRRLEVPLTLVPAGNADYTISLGRNTLDGGGLAQGRVSYGLLPRLTLFSGTDYLGRGTSGRNVLYAGATGRLLANVVASGALAPGAMNQASLYYSAPSQAGLQLSLNDYAPGTPYNRLNIDRQLRFEGMLPMNVGKLSAMFNAYGGESRFIDGGTAYDFNAQLALNIGRLRPSLRVRKSMLQQTGPDLPLADDVTGGLLFFVSSARHRLLNRAVVSASADYDRSERRLRQIEAAVSRAIMAGGRITTGYDWSAIDRRGQLLIRYIHDLPSIQSMTSLQAAAMGGSSLAQTVRGTATLDPATREWTFSGREGIGHGGVVFRCFVDSNGDGVWEPDEETIRGARIRFRQAAAAQTLKDGRIRVSDLLPYHRYSVDIDQTAIQNPLWQPKFASFSFVADPNSFKTVDVPFYAATEIEGTVKQATPAGFSPIGGLAIRIHRTDHADELSVTTFGDGTFYQPGLAPGTYMVEPDPAQLRALRLVAEPAKRTLELVRTSDGNSLSGLDFVLRSAEKAEPHVPSTPDAPAQPAQDGRGR